MKKSLLTFALLIYSLTSIYAQSLICEFDWNDMAKGAQAAKFGKAAKQKGLQTGVVAGGADQTTGLGILKLNNSGKETAPIDFVLEGADFNVDGLEVAMQFNAYNTTGNGELFARLHRNTSKEPVFRLGIRNFKLQARFTLANGEVVELQSMKPVSTENRLTFYSFRYTPETGEAEVYIGTELVAYYVVEEKNVPMDWTAAGDAVIGYNLSLVNSKKKRTKAKPSAVATFDNFSVSSIESEQIITPLPVEFVEVNAKAKGKQAELSWATASETNNAYFAIERSHNGVHFEEIARVKGAGNSMRLLSYNFTDNAPLAGTAYYRIKQVDTDGSSETSKVMAITTEAAMATEMQVYPTLVQGQAVNLKLNGATTGQAELSILSFGGNVVRTKTIDVAEAAAGTQVLENGELSKGAYIVMLTHNGETFRKKLIVR
ncbi:T9SS type A sorting domain-containing protein [Pontibacter actiniarum]|uniref:T9SS C-terminal target domain-containing protein n=1 Tax=Pontibacter actiniarum TaxID=323450 RepID=A0A1X9YPV7_9BACT|nr:T9SS type A sorting domain-containing protein [Pontibacter actiniarum]ARS34874.1 hypothetical protein CA264_05140 [Pontibacter actiniarum]